MNQSKLPHLLLSSLLLTLFITGCNRAAQVEIPVRDKLVTFVTYINTNADAEVTLDFAVANGGNPLPADEAVTASWELQTANGQARAGGNMYGLPPLPGGQDVEIMSWQGKLTPGKYTLTWGAPGYGATVIDFEVIESENSVQIGSQRIFNTTAYPPNS